MNRKPPKFLMIFSYTVSAIVIVAGIGIIAGLIFPPYVPSNFRIITGIVFILYGIYRSVTIWTKSKQTFNNEE
ncbi:MAG: hypothetical protein Q8K98_12215 [Bacteroidota bacterium]|nr:hypothetical protein [Bacteroidota bacterium]